MNIIYYKFKYILILIYLFFFSILLNEIFNLNPSNKNFENKSKRVGIIGFMPDNNLGNILIKYSMYHLLKKYGLTPTLISLKSQANNGFLRKNINIKEIKNYFIDLNESNYDILIVNSDQCWSYRFKRILEIGFLSFAHDWNIQKFVYAASLGYDFWNLSNKVIIQTKNLVKQFSAVSVREQSSIEIIKRYLGVEPSFVLDPTLLLNKNEYLKIINNFISDVDINKKYCCIYILDTSQILKDYIETAKKEMKYNILYITNHEQDYIKKFIFSINLCKSMITDSYHGTIFSIIFEKPFITFINSRRGNARFLSLMQTFELYNRFIFPRKFENNDINLLSRIPNINKRKFHILKEQSLIFLKKNLGILD